MSRPSRWDPNRGAPGYYNRGPNWSGTAGGASSCAACSIAGSSAVGVTGATGGVTGCAACVGSASVSSDTILGAPLPGGAGPWDTLTGGAKVRHPSRIVGEVSVDAMLFGTGLGGESPSVIGRWAVIKLRYFDRRAGSWTASIFLTRGLVVMAAVSFALGKGY